MYISTNRYLISRILINVLKSVVALGRYTVKCKTKKYFLVFSIFLGCIFKNKYKKSYMQNLGENGEKAFIIHSLLKIQVPS